MNLFIEKIIDFRIYYILFIGSEEIAHRKFTMNSKSVIVN